MNSTGSSKARTTIAQQLAKTGGRPSGFDYMRLLLAMSVIAMHSVIISYGSPSEHAFWSSGWRPLVRIILPMFFALSGFLVAGSFERSRTILMFFGLRVIRIYPALLVEVILSAFILGVVLTEVPLAQYFRDPLFHHYLMNMLGDPHYELPGMFLRNPYPGQVNKQLWTVPYELGCYVSLAALSIIGARKKPILAPLAAFAITILYVVGRLIKYHGPPPYQLGPLAGPMLVICFLVGVSIYLYRESLPFAKSLGIGAAIVGMLLVSIIPGGDYVAPWPLAYLTVYLGIINPPRVWFLKGADYSYGLFLYGYPIQQTFASFGDWTHHAILNTIVSISVAGGFAAFSWHFIEKPALRLRKPMTRIEDRWIARPRRTNKANDELAPRPLT